mmetsp:Transcript_40706/g.83221  ORF Transcript_40706/g.83221 Transcript_40706/m.83221 type:complete len:120 (+) Transcript_40706:220-579(+)
MQLWKVAAPKKMPEREEPDERQVEPAKTRCLAPSVALYPQFLGSLPSLLLRKHSSMPAEIVLLNLLILQTKRPQTQLLRGHMRLHLAPSRMGIQGLQLAQRQRSNYLHLLPLPFATPEE